MTFLSKSKKNTHFCNYKLYLASFLILLVLTSIIIAKVNMSESNSKQVNSGFSGGVFYVNKFHKNIADNHIAEHDPHKNAQVHNPNEESVYFDPSNSEIIQSRNKSSFTDMITRYQN